MLLIEDLKVEVGGRPILQHIDLAIAPGETHILFGPNGSVQPVLRKRSAW